MTYSYCPATSDDQAFIGLENPLSPAEKADHIAYLISKGYRSSAIAKRIQIPDYEVRKLARISSKLTGKVMQLLHTNNITLGHARVIAGMPIVDQEEIAFKVITKKISVRALEDYKRGSSKRLDTETTHYYQQLSEKASEIVGHPLTISPSITNKNAGVISIKYSDLNSFDSIFDRLGITLDNY